MKSIIISKNDAGQRLDKFLTKSFKMPASLMYKYLRKKRIKLNKKGTLGNTMLKEGDLLELYINDEFFEKEEKKEFQKGNLNIVYEDENILIMDKEQGLLCHGEGDTLLNRLTAYLIEKGEYVKENSLSFAPALCNRLDRNTAGLLIGAKNAKALRQINELIKNREIKKFYLALCVGSPKEKNGVLLSYLTKDESINKVTISNEPIENAKAISTGFKVLKENNGLSLIEIELNTGRPHQIRAQLSKIGCPIVGDMKYGNEKINKKLNIKYQALYSYKLVFPKKNLPENLKNLSGKVFLAGNANFEDFM